MCRLCWMNIFYDVKTMHYWSVLNFCHCLFLSVYMQRNSTFNPKPCLFQVLLVCIGCGLLILAHSSFQVKAVTLQDTLQGVCGSATSIICSILVALYCFGTCITFLIIIGDQFDRGLYICVLYQCLYNLLV